MLSRSELFVFEILRQASPPLLIAYDPVHTSAGVIATTATQLLQCVYMVCMFGRYPANTVLTHAEHRVVGIKSGLHLSLASALTLMWGPSLYFSISILISIYLSVRLVQETGVVEEEEEEEMIIV